MIDELVAYYNAELAFLREMGAEFAARYPKVASRLLLEADKCEDPHVERMLEAYRAELPLLPGGVEAVQRTAEAFPLALASSSNREVFEAVLELAGIGGCFQATVSSEEVARG